MREHNKLPNLDDVLPNMNKTKVFSKVDVKEAFWHVELDTESSLLTTMINQFGRYRWARLPFGLKVSSELFQKRLNEALKGLTRVIYVADDILVTGCGDTTAMAERDHDENWKRPKQRRKDRTIKLNDNKAVMKQDRVTFMGHSITRDGIMADDAKVKAILEMPAPTDIHGLKRFCGMIQYLAIFMPDLAGYLEPLRKLTRNKAEWDWSPECVNAFTDVKKMISDTPIHPEKELVLQFDSNKYGLGAAMLQDGKPNEYASRSLTPTERRWAQIENELLSVIFGLERFDQYTYGRNVTIHNDHLPLAPILEEEKTLSQAPKRLPLLMLILHRYDVEFQYRAAD